MPDFLPILLVVVILLLVVYIVIQQKSKKSDNSEVELLRFKDEISKGLRDELEKNRESVNSLSEKLNNNVNERLDATHKAIFKGQSETTKIISEVTEKLVNLERTNQDVKEVSKNLQTLQNVLMNPKQRGVVGEFYLESLLDNLFPPDLWQKQFSFQNGEAVDAILRIDNKLLPIDAKFSLENYNRFVGENDKVRKAEYAKLVENDLKLRIKETAKYIRPKEETMDFAFMFIPSEALYYDLIINRVGSGSTSQGLIEYATAAHVVIVSPTTFTAYLQTVLQGLRSLKIEKQAEEIKKNVSKLEDHINRYEEYFAKIGSSLSTTVNHYNSAGKQFALLDKDILKITNSENEQLQFEQIERPSIEL